MGSWGTGAFENDTACDWGYDLEGVDDLSLVEEAIDGALAQDDYLDADVGTCALAACEVLARLAGRWGQRDAYTETVDAWVERHPVVPSLDLIKKALRALDRVLSPESELKRLWDDGDDAERWRSAVAELRTRVSPRAS